MRSTQATASIAMALPGACRRCLEQACVRHMQFNAEGASGRFCGAVDMGLRQAILPVQGAGRGRLPGEQVLVEARLLPVARLIVRTEHAEVEPVHRLPMQFGKQRRAAAHVWRGDRQPRSPQDRCLHQGEGHGGGGVENFPLMGDIVAGVLVAWVHRQLLCAAQHQYCGAVQHQWPQGP